MQRRYVGPATEARVLAERPSLWRTTEVTPPNGDERSNVKKEGRVEPDLWARLYRLEFLTTRTNTNPAQSVAAHSGL